MDIGGIFKRWRVSDSGPSLRAWWADTGIRVDFAAPLVEPTADALLAAVDGAGAGDSVLAAYLSQLIGEGHCKLDHRGALLPWASVYELLSSAEHSGSMQLLNVPDVGELRPIVDSAGTLSDPDFSLSVTGWICDNKPVKVDRFQGAVAVARGESRLLPHAAWQTLQAIKEFGQRGEGERGQAANELAWGRIRAKADSAGASYANPYLETTVVLTPETLRLRHARVPTPFGQVIQVEPGFDGAPTDWLRAFDSYGTVQPHYDLTGGGGRVRVVISAPVRRVLEVIRREMPGRRVAGAKAERFIQNPFAFLGEAAREVLDEEEFEEDRSASGVLASDFSLAARYDAGRIRVVDVRITEHFADRSAETYLSQLDSPSRLDEFLSTVERAIGDERQFAQWEEFDLNLDGDTATKIEGGRQLLAIWRAQPAERIELADVYEMEGYSRRIEGIGPLKPIYVPVFQKEKKDDDESGGWLPDDLTPMVQVTLNGQEGAVLIPLTREWVGEFEKKVAHAEADGRAEVTDPALPTAIGTPQARTLAASFAAMLGLQERVKGDGAAKPKEPAKPRQTLIVKTSFHRIDYIEARGAALAMPESWAAELPRCLRPSVQLKQHQLYGVSWFQNLVSKGPKECRGALLADDMGLGKTLQLLSVLAWYYELHPDSPPSLIVAPKSLVENWQNEARKFFTPSFPETLVLYGDALAERKQPLALIDEQLLENRITELLKPAWVGASKLIITTYEVLTNYEFSFAKQPFKFVICDEAQRIKTPGTLVTLAAKKLKAEFRVACTGTPVENSLADLWCLFDFVQPGLLGALGEFAQIYRRPIECETDEQRAALEQLQATIAPQTLRRTKASIASELTKKFFALRNADESVLRFKEALDEDERLEVALTDHQNVLYKAGLKKLQDAAKEANCRKRAKLSFGALHLMKAVCAEPYCLPGTKFLVDKEGREIHLSRSPKLRWLLDHLADVRRKGEKAIVFTEIREIQAALYYFLRETFGIKASIINGDSQGRQAVIDKFSEAQGFNVIILSTLAAGAGLNVTAANHVFHFTRAWNPAKESQATDRAYRIGQEKDVFVYCPTVVADFVTFEVRLDQLLWSKARLSGATLDDGGITQMLNGSGKDASFSEMVGGGVAGEAAPQKPLTMDDVDRMDGDGFEAFCCLLWSKQGYNSQVTEKRGGDGGIDIVALKGREGVLIQCKSSKSAAIGWDAIKEVHTGATRYRERMREVRLRTLAVTNQRFSSGAVEHAHANGVELVLREQLADMLRLHPITNHDFDSVFADA